jgi:uncharacterized protein with HEPN domain
MSRDPRVYLEDILESIRRIRIYVEGIDQGGLGADELRLDAVVRNLEVIGEAVKRLPEDLRTRESGVEWNKIAGLRDILIHHYFGIDIAIIWDVVETKIPDFERQIRIILERLEKD